MQYKFAVNFGTLSSRTLSELEHIALKPTKASVLHVLKFLSDRFFKVYYSTSKNGQVFDILYKNIKQTLIKWLNFRCFLRSTTMRRPGSSGKGLVRNNVERDDVKFADFSAFWLRIFQNHIFLKKTCSYHLVYNLFYIGRSINIIAHKKGQLIGIFSNLLKFISKSINLSIKELDLP